jgi:hypothetical protein
LVNVSKIIDNSSFNIIEYKTERIEYDNFENVIFVDIKLKTSRKDEYYKFMDGLYNNKKIFKIEVLQNQS